MMELFGTVLGNLISPSMLLACLTGTIIGIVLGAIPGMNGGIGIAVMLPFTYSMAPAEGLAFLGGMYVGSSYGGSIAGILINVPGTAESACTTMEGYPMTLRGEGRHALYYSVLSSAFGSIVGLVALVLFAPMLSNVAVKFGPPEMLLVSLCGLTIVGSLTGKDIVKGLFAACFGLFLSMIGIDDISATFRFTFGTRFLRGGVDLIPAVIGLFAIAEMVKQGIASSTSQKQEVKLLPVRVRQIWHHIWHDRLWLLLKSSFIGTFIGILPGTGGAISSFLAYGAAKREDTTGTFGKGNPDGIIAPEAANNAAVGGSLVPMLALGIPGSSTSAIMFGALTIHGLVPGQSLFSEHGEVVYTFFGGMFLVTFFMLLIGIVGIPFFSRIVKINTRRIIPFVVLFSLIGAYSVNNAISDVLIAVIMGVIGVFFSRVEIPTTPVVLGLILGDLIESNYVRTVTIAHAEGKSVFVYMFTRPICIFLLLLTAYLIFANVRALNKSRRIQKETNSTQDLQEG
jgi:putative tricarboxylic transport membrane protein